MRPRNYDDEEYYDNSGRYSRRNNYSERMTNKYHNFESEDDELDYDGPWKCDIDWDMIDDNPDCTVTDVVEVLDENGFEYEINEEDYKITVFINSKADYKKLDKILRKELGFTNEEVMSILYDI